MSNKIYLIKTIYNVDNEEGERIRATKSEERAKEIFEEEKANEGITKEIFESLEYFVNDLEEIENPVTIDNNKEYFIQNEFNGDFINIQIEEIEEE
jgi:hypothetical protein